MKNSSILLFWLALNVAAPAGADIVSTDSNGQISVQTGKMDNLCVNSGSAACGTITAGLGHSNRVGINTTSPATALDVSGTITATAITSTLTGASSLNVLKTGDTMTGALTITAAGVSASSSATSGVVLQLDGAYTTAQIQAKTPTAAGQLVYNSTLANICVSTGAVVQGYKLAGSASTTCQ